MPAADARALCPGLREWARDPELYAREETGLAASLLAATPQVGRAGPGSFWLDARGWGRRGGEPAFVGTLRSVTLAVGYPEARIGLADTPAAARAATRLKDRPVHRVPPGDEARFLAPLPIRVLPVSGDLLDLLEALGLETVGALAALEPAEVEGRLGAEGVRAHRLARGLDDGRERPGGVRPPGEWEVAVELPGPTMTLEPVLFLLKSCLDRLSEDLSAEGLCVRILGWTIETEDGPAGGKVRPARPTRQAPLLLSLCRDALRDLRLPGRALALRIEAEEVARPAAEQTDLFEAPRPDPYALASTLDRLRGRWGRESVVRPVPVDSHRPEATGRWEPVDLERPAGSAASDFPPRADGAAPGPGDPGAFDPLTPVLRLWSPPRPLEVRIEDGRPGAVAPEGRWRRVRSVAGPERLSGEWWEDPYRREYYRLTVGSGEVLWVFYEPGDRRWFWHGWWD